MRSGPVQGSVIFDSQVGPKVKLQSGSLTLNGTHTMAVESVPLLFLDANGAGRTVLLPPEQRGLQFTIVNTATGDFALTIKEDSNTTIIKILTKGESGEFYCDGTTWFSMNAISNGGSFSSGSDATDRVTIKGFYKNPAPISVSVPSIVNDVAENIDSVVVSVAAAFSIQPAVGDAVIAIPLAALPTDCLLLSAYVTATDNITVTFGSREGGAGVTGAAVNFDFFVIDLT
jgi:hypothetical protein